MEKVNNANFKGVEFDSLLKEAGTNSFTMSPTRFIREFNAKGFRVILSKDGGTYAHKDIALEFASWISPEVKLYIVKEFQRLKIKETGELEWKGNRFLARLNYFIHTETIKEHLITIELDEEQILSKERIVLLNREANKEKIIFNNNNKKCIDIDKI